MGLYLSNFLTKELFLAINELLLQLSVAPDLQAQAFNMLLFNFRIWSNSSPEMQDHFSQSLEGLLNHFQIVSRCIDITHILDEMRLHYWIVPDPDSYLRQEEIPVAQILSIRLQILNFVYNFIDSRQGCRKEYYKAIIDYLQSDSHPTQFEDVSQMLLLLIRKAPLIPNLMESIKTYGHLSPWISIMESPSEIVKSAALKMIGAYCYHCKEDKSQKFVFSHIYASQIVQVRY